jgi:hypothetical protein
MRMLSLVFLVAAAGLAAEAEARGLRQPTGLRALSGHGSLYNYRNGFSPHGYYAPYSPPGYAPCSAYAYGMCGPNPYAPIGQDLQVTVESRRIGEYAKPDHALDTLADLFAALRACWQPPADARDGMAMSVRFAFKRSGQIIAPPFITYVSREFPAEQRDAFRDTIMAGLDACAPLQFTAGLGGAVAGRPIAIRYIDNRDAGAPPAP